MEAPNSEQEFRKLLDEIIRQEPIPMLSEEEIHFDALAMRVLHLVGDRWVIWLN